MPEGISRPDLWEKAEKKVGKPTGFFDTFKVWREYWRLLEEDG